MFWLKVMLSPSEGYASHSPRREVVMHLTCTNVTVDEVREVLKRCKAKGLTSSRRASTRPERNGRREKKGAKNIWYY